MFVFFCCLLSGKHNNVSFSFFSKLNEWTKPNVQEEQTNSGKFVFVLFFLFISSGNVINVSLRFFLAN